MLRMGQILASYDEIVKYFGDPSIYKGMSKEIDIIWEVPMTNNQNATIYNHKKSGNPLGYEGIDKHIRTVWNIGGQSKLSVIFIYSMMGTSIDTLKTKLR